MKYGALPEVDLLLAGHHGSQNAASQLLLDTVEPSLAAVSVGYNSTGTAPETLRRLEESGCQHLPHRFTGKYHRHRGSGTRVSLEGVYGSKDIRRRCGGVQATQTGHLGGHSGTVLYLSRGGGLSSGLLPGADEKKAVPRRYGGVQPPHLSAQGMRSQAAGAGGGLPADDERTHDDPGVRLRPLQGFRRGQGGVHRPLCGSAGLCVPGVHLRSHRI